MNFLHEKFEKNLVIDALNKIKFENSEEPRQGVLDYEEYKNSLKILFGKEIKYLANFQIYKEKEVKTLKQEQIYLSLLRIRIDFDTGFLEGFSVGDSDVRNFVHSFPKELIKDIEVFKYNFEDHVFGNILKTAKTIRGMKFILPESENLREIYLKGEEVSLSSLSQRYIKEGIITQLSYTTNEPLGKEITHILSRNGNIRLYLGKETLSEDDIYEICAYYEKGEVL